MGREAECVCTWGAGSAKVKALLESRELIVRGEIRRKVPFPQMEQVRAEQGRLVFRFQGEEVSLALGDATALQWQRAIHAPPVTLAQKLGITPESFVWSLGEAADAELEAALSAAQGPRSDKADLIVASVDSIDDLAKALGATAAQVGTGVPLWIVYPKGKGHAVSEAAIRSAARNLGLIDTKVASISPRLTGLRFVLRK